MSVAPNSAKYTVVDAVGDEHLVTFADLDYEARFRKHARWWLNYMRQPRQRHDGRWVYGPVRPTRIVVEPYFDKTSS